MKKMLLCIVMGCILDTVHAQDTIQNSKPSIEFSGYIDGYYSYDFTKPNTSKKLPFLYSYNSPNSFAINMALLRASISYENVYAKLSVHSGTYVDENYNSEPIKILNEAYLGVYLNRSKKTSLELGIMPSYIGFESATSHINLTATRSILAENSPYYMTGLKVTHQFNEKLSGSFLVTNGWQHIQKADKNLPPALGTQLTYKSSESTTLNWSTFAGREFNGFEYRFRFFNNAYWDYVWNSHWHTITGFDYGIQDQSSENNVFDTWFSPILITQYTFSKKWQMAHRIEYYDDKKNVMIAYPVAFQTLGNSINLDFLPNTYVKLRTEAKWYHATEGIFDDKKDNFSWTTTMSFEF